MMRKLLILAAAFALLGPSASFVGVGVLMNPAAAASCTTGSLNIGPVPDSLTATMRSGEVVTLNRTQLTHAATIITAGQSSGVGRQGALVALMAALTESGLRMLANTSAYPESGGYVNDGNGSDHDSLGLFQMRPQSGWGTVEQLMDPQYQAAAFYGGPDGPNHGSPRGLLDIPSWEELDPGAAAQAVEVSTYPDRYQNYQPVAEMILTALTTATGGGEAPGVTPPVPETTRIVFPLPEGTWVKTSPWGMRVNPITGRYVLHTGTDYAAPDGTTILAIADGVVADSGYDDAYGGHITIEHTIGGQPVASVYIHMWATGIHVTPGQTVTAGQYIGDVGSSGNSTGPHLHFEIHPGGAEADSVDSDAWLTDHTAQTVTTGETTPATCTLDTTGGDS